MSGDMVKVFALVALILVMASLMVLAFHRSKRAAEDQDKERREQIKIGIKRGVCDELGNPLCVVCKVVSDENKVATEYTPVTGRPWWDSIPIISRARELWALPDRYTVIDDPSQARRLCKQHKAMAVRRLASFHAQLRSEHSKFNAQLRERVDFMDGGGTETLVIKSTQEIRSTLGFDEVMKGLKPQLGEGEESFALPVSTYKAGQEEET